MREAQKLGFDTVFAPKRAKASEEAKSETGVTVETYDELTALVSRFD